MSTEVHFNAPVKNCQTCAHCYPDDYFKKDISWNHCARYGGHITASAINVCRMNEWRQKPPELIPEPSTPRRSLRQWIFETFWRIE